VLLLGASAPGCFLPELVVDGSEDGSGGGDANESGGASSGGESSSGGGGDDTGGSDSSGGNSDGGTGGGGSGGEASGGDGSGGEASGGESSGGGPSVVPGYYESGVWQGRVSTFANGASIEPAAFDGVTDAPYCMTGAVAPSEDVSGIAGFSWYLDQAASCAGAGCVPPASTATPERDGVVVRLDNPGGSDLRLEVLGPNGDTDANDRWCVDLGAADGVVFVPWDDFNTVCWAGGTGSTYAMEDLQRLVVSVPGLGQGEGNVNFDFCVEIVGESNPPGGGCGTADAPGFGSYSLSGTETASVLRNAHPYLVKGNLWGDSGSQVIEGTGTSFEILTAGSGSGFPGVFVGELGSQDSTTAWLPRDSLTFISINTSWAWSGALAAGEVALWEMRFSSTMAASDPPSQVMQLWLEAAGRVPGGAQIDDYVDGGTTWEVFYIETPPAAVFVASPPIKAFAGNGLAFVSHAMARGALDDSDFITSVAAGFQTASGGGVGLRVVDFCASQQ
jgi:hypothetical protein